MPIRLTQAQLDELDRRSADLKSGRTKGIPLEVVLREDVYVSDEAFDKSFKAVLRKYGSAFKALSEFDAGHRKKL